MRYCHSAYFAMLSNWIDAHKVLVAFIIFKDEEETEYEIFLYQNSARKWIRFASFWREHAIIVVILLRL